jgi:hypothetical protein
MVATVDGGLHCIGDGVDHHIHGRYGVCHLLPWVEMQRHRRTPSPSFSASQRQRWSVQIMCQMKSGRCKWPMYVSIDEERCIYTKVVALSVLVWKGAYPCEREKFTAGPSTWLKVLNFQSDICGSLNLAEGVIQVPKLLRWSPQVSKVNKGCHPGP